MLFRYNLKQIDEETDNADNENRHLHAPLLSVSTTVDGEPLQRVVGVHRDSGIASAAFAQHGVVVGVVYQTTNAEYSHLEMTKTKRIKGAFTLDAKRRLQIFTSGR